MAARESGIVFKQLVGASAPLFMGAARVWLGKLKQLMSFQGLQQLVWYNIRLAPGVTCAVSSVHGQDTIKINASALEPELVLPRCESFESGLLDLSYGPGDPDDLAAWDAYLAALAEWKEGGKVGDPPSPPSAGWFGAGGPHWLYAPSTATKTLTTVIENGDVTWGVPEALKEVYLNAFPGGLRDMAACFPPHSFSGSMRKVVQMLYGSGRGAPFSNSFLATDGIFVSAAGSKYLVTVSNRGVFISNKPLPMCHIGRDGNRLAGGSAGFLMDQGWELPALDQLTTLLPAGAMADLYDNWGEMFYGIHGAWAFSQDGHEAQIVVIRAHENGNTLSAVWGWYTARAKVTILENAGSGFSAQFSWVEKDVRFFPFPGYEIQWRPLPCDPGEARRFCCGFAVSYEHRPTEQNAPLYVWYGDNAEQVVSYVSSYQASYHESTSNRPALNTMFGGNKAWCTWDKTASGVSLAYYALNGTPIFTPFSEAPELVLGTVSFQKVCYTLGDGTWGNSSCGGAIDPSDPYAWSCTVPALYPDFSICMIDRYAPGVESAWPPYNTDVVNQYAMIPPYNEREGLFIYSNSFADTHYFGGSTSNYDGRYTIEQWQSCGVPSDRYNVNLGSCNGQYYNGQYKASLSATCPDGVSCLCWTTLGVSQGITVVPKGNWARGTYHTGETVTSGAATVYSVWSMLGNREQGWTQLDADSIPLITTLFNTSIYDDVATHVPVGFRSFGITCEVSTRECPFAFVIPQVGTPTDVYETQVGEYHINGLPYPLVTSDVVRLAGPMVFIGDT